MTSSRCLLFCLLFSYAALQPAIVFGHNTTLIYDRSIVTHEFRYYIPEADEVFLVWGINGWGLVTEKIRPPGTAIKKAAMHTPMRHEGDSFIAKVRPRSGRPLTMAF
jgi:hypothetical protein